MKLSFEYESNIIEFKVEYRKRKTMSIKIELDGEIKVSVPIRAKEEDIIKAVKSKAKWIIKKSKELELLAAKKVDRGLINGNTLMYLGEEYPINIILDNKVKKIEVSILYGKFIIKTNTEEESAIKHAVTYWYGTKTLELVLELVDKLQPNFKMFPTVIKVKEQKRSWGTCSSKRALHFNWRISMANIDVIEYIVLHEMCHMIHMNHSKDYWDEVEKIMPNYKVKKLWLKENGMKMEL